MLSTGSFSIFCTAVSTQLFTVVLDEMAPAPFHARRKRKPTLANATLGNGRSPKPSKGKSPSQISRSNRK
jgi:hypothetical protein